MDDALTDASYCRVHTAQADEPLLGTANDGVTSWVLVEHAGHWGPKVPKQAEELPESAREQLRKLDDEDGVRVQLIRRPGGLLEPGRPWVFVVSVDPADPGRSRAVGRQLDGVGQLDSLSLEAELSGATGALEQVEPLYLVCTHGARDRCCAKWGMPVFKRLCALAGDSGAGRVWQASHLGGHRFAPVVLTLPDGYVYGRVGIDGDVEAETERLFAETEAGRIYDLERVRGRSCLRSPVQFADVSLRRREGWSGHNDLSLLEHRREDGARMRHVARFLVTGGEVELAVEPSKFEFRVLGSCGDDSLKRMRPWRVAAPVVSRGDG